MLVRNYLTPYISTLVDPDREKNEQARLKAQANLQRLRRVTSASEVAARAKMAADELPAAGRRG